MAAESAAPEVASWEAGHFSSVFRGAAQSQQSTPQVTYLFTGAGGVGADAGANGAGASEGGVLKGRGALSLNGTPGTSILGVSVTAVPSDVAVIGEAVRAAPWLKLGCAVPPIDSFAIDRIPS